MLWFLWTMSAMADSKGYGAVDANVGLGTSYGQGRLNTASVGMNFNVEAAAGTVSDDPLPTSMFFHSRVDFDVGGIYSLDDEQVDLGMDWRINLHTGFQFFGFLPVNFAMKDARFGFYRDSFVTHGLYGVGILIPKEYFMEEDDELALNMTVSIGTRVRADFSSSPAGVQPEILLMNEDYSARLGFLQTFGSSDSQERSITGLLARKDVLIKGTQIGLQWRYASWQDVPTDLDEQQIEVMLFFGGNPKFDF
jgi:hypothetical protein